MAATFFERQHQARRNTKLMIALFLAAVAGIVIAVDVVASGAWLWLHPRALRAGAAVAVVPMWVHVASFLGSGGAILAVSLWEDLRLTAGGGAAVAQMANARRV